MFMSKKAKEALRYLSSAKAERLGRLAAFKDVAQSGLCFAYNNAESFSMNADAGRTLKVPGVDAACYFSVGYTQAVLGCFMAMK